MLNLKLLGKVIIIGKIKAITGLHIGGAQGALEIGGVDNGVIKDAEGKPYIPGSSLKGKLRSLLERYEGYLTTNNMVYQKNMPIRLHLCDSPDCPVCLIFGRNKGEYSLADVERSKLEIKNNVSPTRIQVRDAFLIEESVADIKDNLDFDYTEVKFENSLDRITSAANPRQTERVPRGAEFSFEIVFNVLCEEDKALFKKLLTAMKLLEDDCLGGSGSRGYGKVEFCDVKVFWRSRKDYETGQFKAEPVAVGALTELIGKTDIVAKFA